MTRTWVRCLAWWGMPCIAWEREHQEHPFAFWSLIGEEEAGEIRRENMPTARMVRVAWAV